MAALLPSAMHSERKSKVKSPTRKPDVRAPKFVFRVYRPGDPPPQARTPEEIRAWLVSLAEFSDKFPPLPENITRD